MRAALLSLFLVLPPVVQAQNPPSAADTAWNSAAPAGMMLPQDPARAAMLRAQVEERFGRMVQTNLALSDPVMVQVRTALRANQDRRIALNRRQQDLQLAMQRQMQPGEAANADSVARLTEAMSHLRLERAQSDDQLVRDLAFLPPVKRAQLLNMMQRFEQRIQEIRRTSMQGRPMGFRRNRMP